MIIIISCIVRVLFFLAFTHHNDNAWILFDSQQYLSIANNIVNHNEYSIQQGTPTCYRLPGYPFFLAAGFALFGQSLFTTLLLQVLLASFMPIGIFLLTYVLYPQSITVAKYAAIIASVHAGFILYAGMIATESLCLLFLVLFFILFFYAIRAHTSPELVERVEVWSAASRILFFAGILLGFASLMRPVGHYILVLALMYVIAQKQTLKKILSLSLGFLIPVSPWLIRNFLLTGALFFHSLPGLHFLQFTAAPVVATVNTISYVQARQQVLQEWDKKIADALIAQHAPVTEYQKCCLGEKLAFDYVRQYPKETFIHSSTQILKTYFALYAAQIILSDNKEWPDYYSKNQSAWSKIKRYLVPQVKTKWLIPFIYWEILLFSIMLLGCLFCFVSAGWQKNVLYMLGRTVPFASLLIVLTVAYGCARLRFPAEPFLILWSCVGWQQMLKKLF
jgi:hypothetical protein